MNKQFNKLNAKEITRVCRKAIDTYTGGDYTELVNIIQEDEILSTNTKDNLLAILENKDTFVYQTREYLIDRYYVNSKIETSDIFSIVAIAMEILGVQEFEYNRRIYKTLDGEYSITDKSFDVLNLKCMLIFNQVNFCNLVESTLKMHASKEDVQLTENDFIAINNRVSRLWEAIELSNLIIKEIDENSPTLTLLDLNKVLIKEKHLSVKSIDFTKRFSINPVTIGIEAFDRLVTLKETVLDERLHLILFYTENEVALVPTDCNCDIFISDAMMLAIVLKYYKLMELDVEYNIKTVEGKMLLGNRNHTDTRKVTRIKKESVSQEAKSLADKWNFNLEENESIFRKQLLKFS